jgi:glycine cleavage system pyridoxal-binding protein P
MKLNADYQEQFQSRHIAPNEADTAKMLKTIGVSSLDELIAQTIPDQIRLKNHSICRLRKASLTTLPHLNKRH